MTKRLGDIRCQTPASSFRAKREIFIIGGSGTHAFLTCSAHLSAFLICLSSRQCPIRPFGAPPSIGRRECPRSEAGLVSFFAAKPPSICLSYWGRGTAQRRSGAFVNCLLETISLALFHPAFPIQPPPLRGTSFHRKEGVSTQRGGVGFLFCGEASFYLPFLLGKGDRAAALGCFRKLPA